MRWLIGGAVALVAVVVVVMVVGSLLPEAHTASSRIRLSQAPEAVWGVVRDIGEYPSWWPTAEGVERLPDQEGREAWRQLQSTGSIPMMVVSEDPPTSFVTRIIDEGLPFGGTWTYEVSRDGSGSTVTITEDGRVYSALFRFVSRFVMGHHGTMDSYLSALGERFGEPVTPEHVR